MSTPAPKSTPDPFTVFLAIGAATFGPFLFGYISFSSALFALGAIVLFAIVVLNASPQSNDISRWFADHPILGGALLFFLTLEVLLGAVAGLESRSADARDRVRREAEEAEQNNRREREAAVSEAREVASRRARLVIETARVEADRAAAAAEARRTPQDRARLMVDILRGLGDAGAPPLRDRVCLARRQLAAIGQSSRELREVRAAAGALDRAEHSALQEIREAARGYRMVRCCDGINSPSCECSRSSHRGCCSHHGGMCGCEPLPTEITCAP